MSNKKVVILGGGFGGLVAAQNLDPKTTEVTLIDRKNHHLFQPLLFQVATAALSEPTITEPLRSILSGKKNVTTYQEEITGVDFDKKSVITQNRTHPYDYLIIAVGAKTGYFGNNHWAEHTLGMKTLEESIKIREQILSALEKAELETDPIKRKALMTVVVVGGGPTGVEMAGSLSEMAHQVLVGNYRNIDPAKLHVILIEALPRLLVAFPEALSESALDQIKELGVDVRLNTKVKDIQPEKVILEGEEIAAHTIVWAAGVEAASLTRSLGLKTDRGGRIEVEPDCSVTGHPEVFAIGDCVRLVDRNGVAVPGVSPGAVQMGEHVVRLIHRELAAGDGVKPPREAFSYFDKGSMAIIGRSRAVAKMGPILITRFPAWVAWLGVHVLFLAGWKNKFNAVFDWTWTFLTRQRSARVIIK